TFDVEAEAARTVTANAGGGQPGEKIADVMEHAGVSGRIAARGASNGRLVDHDHFVQRFLAFDSAMSARPFLGAEPVPEQSPPQNGIDQSALAGAAHAADPGARSER